MNSIMSEWRSQLNSKSLLSTRDCLNVYVLDAGEMNNSIIYTLEIFDHKFLMVETVFSTLYSSS